MKHEDQKMRELALAIAALAKSPTAPKTYRGWLVFTRKTIKKLGIKSP